MKDSTKFLNFNPDRQLKFNPFRRPTINSQRQLIFDLNRELVFNPNRDLGFGKRGVVFRGYVCPVCGAQVGKYDPQCDECGVKFKQTKSEVKKETEWHRGRKVSVSKSERKKSNKGSANKKGRKTFECPVCGKLLYVGASTCPGCGIDFNVSDEKVMRSPSRPASKDGPVCSSCGHRMIAGDRFCRHCGATKPTGSDRTTVSWDEYRSKSHDDGIVTWEGYSKRG